LGEVLVSIDAGKAIKTPGEPAQEGELGVLKISAITWGRFRPMENKAVPPGFEAGSIPRVCGGDLLITRANTVDLVGAVAIAEDLYPNLLLSDRTLRLVPEERSADSRYLMYALRSPWARRHIEGRATGTSGSMRNITQETIRGSPIPLPPLPEQRRIADILDRADAVRRKRQEAIKLTEEFLRSAFLEMFGDPVTNPKGWPVEPLIRLVEEGRPITYGILKPGPDRADGVPYVRVVDMRDGSVDISGVRRTTHQIARQYRRSTLRIGDLLMSIRGHVGRLAVTPAELDGANITQDTARLAAGHRIGTEFLFAALQQTSTQRWMQQRIKGVAVKGINLGDVKQLPMPVPPPGLQDGFRRLFNGLRQVERHHERQLRALDDLFNSLVQQAFNGEL